ncbi:hypothetical protein GCM10008904_28190 [Paraclostridium ghonii]|uniref:Uncharacterized protein n=1 Tax=Paraclostridium ghonii TaxID=29358 RepID=A0ABU0N3Z7_9FIRM|nr:hypothetical protein [Paeniclostridium ghonii]MCM0166130.1 hypothetical protein [Paeniclostridium ghonii]MDQ0557694.1 hypothetical protein [Paeniclostridium ghonii]
MKKKIIALLLVSCFLLSLSSNSTYALNLFKEGVYKVADLNFSEENKYIVQNVSQTEGAYLQVFDENQVLVQSIRFPPNSEKFNLVRITPEFRIVIVGAGNIYIYPSTEG